MEVATDPNWVEEQGLVKLERREDRLQSWGLVSGEKFIDLERGGVIFRCMSMAEAHKVPIFLQSFLWVSSLLFEKR